MNPVPAADAKGIISISQNQVTSADNRVCSTGKADEKTTGGKCVVHARTCACPGHVGVVEIRLAVVAHKLAIRAVERSGVRADFLNLFRAAILVWLEDRSVRLFVFQTFRVACDDVAAQPGGEGGTELGRRPDAGLLEVWRDGGGVREDVSCACHKDGGLLLVVVV